MIYAEGLHLSLSAELDGLQMGMPSPFTGVPPESRSCQVLQLQPRPSKVIFTSLSCSAAPAANTSQQCTVSTNYPLLLAFRLLPFLFSWLKHMYCSETCVTALDQGPTKTGF